MEEFGITCDGNKFIFRECSFFVLSAAVNYARLQEKK